MISCAEAGSCVELNIEYLTFWCLLATNTHTVHLAVPTTPMWGKTTAAATNLFFQAVTKERPPSVPPLSMLLTAAKVSSVQPSKHNTRRPHTKSVKLACPFLSF